MRIKNSISKMQRLQIAASGYEHPDYLGLGLLHLTGFQNLSGVHCPPRKKGIANHLLKSADCLSAIGW
jgi:hypothetical protein